VLSHLHHKLETYNSGQLNECPAVGNIQLAYMCGLWPLADHSPKRYTCSATFHFLPSPDRDSLIVGGCEELCLFSRHLYNRPLLPSNKYELPLTADYKNKETPSMISMRSGVEPSRTHHSRPGMPDRLSNSSRHWLHNDEA
jgi:hypothetical protein